MTRLVEWLAPASFGPRRPWGRPEAAHLLRRCAFGHSPTELERIETAGPDGAAQLLIAGEAPGPREELVLGLREHALRSEDPDDFACWLWSWWQCTRHPLRARMQLLWHDHFATGVSKVRTAFWMAGQFESFAEHGLGSFPVLLEEIAKSPAMLRWLDNEENRKGQANENFARELFELFTLGRGNYSEQDVQEAARAFTGWRIAREAFFFDRRRHDDGEKLVLGERGAFGGEDVLRVTCSQEACAEFLARKLLAAFVGPKTPPEAVPELAAVLRKNELHIGRSLAVLLRSELFFAEEHRASRIRGPVEWILWALRSLGSHASPKELHRAASRMGQELLDPPDVAGWPEEEAWISTTTWVQRSNFATALGRDRGRLRLRPRLAEWLPRSAEAQLEALAVRLFPEGMDAETRKRLLQQAAQERALRGPTRSAGLLAALLLLPAAQRF